MIKSSISLKDSVSRDGFALLRGVVTSSELDNLGENIHSLEPEKVGAAGLRLLLKRSKAVRRFAQSSAMLSIAEAVLGSASRPVKAIPEYRIPREFFGIRLKDRELTMRELVADLIQLNPDLFIDEMDSDQKIWNRLVDVIVRQVNVSRDKITPSAWFTRDLGIC